MDRYIEYCRVPTTQQGVSGSDWKHNAMLPCKDALGCPINDFLRPSYTFLVTKFRQFLPSEGLFQQPGLLGRIPVVRARAKST
jgi:hypothetical protein